MRGKRSKNSEKKGQLDWKWRGKMVQNTSNLLNGRIWWNIRSTLGSIISGINVIDAKPFFSVERGYKKDRVGHKLRAQWDVKMPTMQTIILHYTHQGASLSNT